MWGAALPLPQLTELGGDDGSGGDSDYGSAGAHDGPGLGHRGRGAPGPAACRRRRFAAATTAALPRSQAAAETAGRRRRATPAAAAAPPLPPPAPGCGG